jgi:hypothetical protein
MSGATGLEARRKCKERFWTTPTSRATPTRYRAIAGIRRSSSKTAAMQSTGKRTVHAERLRHPPHGLGKQNPVPFHVFLYIYIYIYIFPLKKLVSTHLFNIRPEYFRERKVLDTSAFIF